MTTATEYLDAFNNSFVNKDKSFIDAIMADNFMIHITGLDETMTRQECLEWSENVLCAGRADYTIIQGANDCIAGTHRAWGTSEDGDWRSKCFFFAKKTGGKITEWYVRARPIVD